MATINIKQIEKQIELKNICKSFDNKIVLSNINLTFNSNEIYCIMGHSGRGKTTLVNIIAGLVKPDEGTIVGIENKRLSIVFQEDRLLNWETALNNVLFVTKKAVAPTLNKKSVMPLALQLLIEAGLGDSINKKAAQLSGGMRRRVCVCRALIAEYDLLILDEPFKGLDGDIKLTMMDMVKKQNINNKFIICITHDPSEAEYLGGKLILL